MIIEKLHIAVKEVSILEEDKTEALSFPGKVLPTYAVPQVLAKFILPAAWAIDDLNFEFAAAFLWDE